MKDLYRWSADPIGLLEKGATAGRVFQLHLWRKAIVGYGPGWNRAVLSDLETFPSRGGLSALTPYLNGGVVHLDQPAHDPRRRELNPHLHSRALSVLKDRLATTVAVHMPEPEFDALHWSGRVVRHMLNAAFFDGAIPDALLAQFVAPLGKSMPSPLLPRPVLFARMNRAIAGQLPGAGAPSPRGEAQVGAPPGGAAHRDDRAAGPRSPYTLAAAMHRVGDTAVSYDTVEELRVSLAAGYDTTAHTLAWAIWQLGNHPQWQDPAALPLVVNEVLRLYPAGWLGSRTAATDTVTEGVPIRRGTLVCYSPYLTHRDPGLWPDPEAFQPERFEGRPQPWTYLPFAAGSRTCLGMHLARLMLETALTPLCEAGLTAIRGDAGIRTGITLRPAGPLWTKRGYA